MVSRLTTKTSIMGRKHDLQYGCAKNWKKVERYYLIENAVDKLGELEDIEEELGIDLITLFTAKKEGIYYKTINHNIYYISKNCLCLEFNYEWELWVENHSILEGLLIHLKDYKKTWALCMEDLKSE